MKMDTRGVIRPDDKGQRNLNVNILEAAKNSPRFVFRVGIVGGGISGLACAEELLRLGKRFEQDLDLEVVIIEARDRLGGRIFTDKETFKDKDGNVIPFDLGASWIHGKDFNPLAAKARERNMSLMATSEKVKLFDGPNSVVDDALDHKIEKLFNRLLDDAVSGGNIFQLSISSQVMIVTGLVFHNFEWIRLNTFGVKILGISRIDGKMRIDGTLLFILMIKDPRNLVGPMSRYTDIHLTCLWIWLSVMFKMTNRSYRKITNVDYYYGTRKILNMLLVLVFLIYL